MFVRCYTFNAQIHACAINSFHVHTVRFRKFTDNLHPCLFDGVLIADIVYILFYSMFVVGIGTIHLHITNRKFPDLKNNFTRQKTISLKTDFFLS
jgi:hypothetical protein